MSTADTTSSDPAVQQRLAAEIAAVRTEIQRADTKATALLTALSLPLAVLAAVVPGRDLPVASAALVAVGGAGLLAAMVAALSVLRPRIGGAPPGTFLYWATCTPEQLLADLARQGQLAEDLVRLSVLARAKFGRLRLAVDITTGALTVLAAGALPAL
jgi:hypothetical protein